MQIKRLHPEAILPSYAHPGDAGMDLYSCEQLVIPPQERRLIKTGISLAIPPGYVGLIWDRSGLASKHGLKSMAGVIDTGYRGEVCVLIHNLSLGPFTVEKGMKISQMLIQPVTQMELEEVASLDDTDRGAGGFGSTGLR